MRIAIDGYNLALERGTGIATYARNLSFALHEAGHEVNVVYGAPRISVEQPLMRQIALFDQTMSEESPAAERWRSRWRRLKLPFGLTAKPVESTGVVITEHLGDRLPYSDYLWNVDDLFAYAHYRFRLTGKFLTVRLPRQVDVAQWTYPTALRIAGARNLYTIHDLIPLRLPYTTPDPKDEYLRLLQAIARRADGIVTVSECSKADIETHLPEARGKVANLSQTVRLPEKLLGRPLAEVEKDLTGKFGLKLGGYFLFFGSIEPKKNVGRLMEAHLAADTGLPLVIVSAQAWRTDGELRVVDDLVRNYGREKLAERILRLEYASQHNLISLIRGSRGVVFPSLYEGFGLPVLEAMMCGAAVLCSNTSSLPEIATAETAILVDPYDIDQITAGLRALAGDAHLARRLGEAGKRRARLFDWSSYVERVKAFYASLPPR